MGCLIYFLAYKYSRIWTSPFNNPPNLRCCFMLAAVFIYDKTIFSTTRKLEVYFYLRSDQHGYSIYLIQLYNLVCKRGIYIDTECDHTNVFNSCCLFLDKRAGQHVGSGRYPDRFSWCFYSGF